MTDKSKDDEYNINPNSFYKNIEGVYDHKNKKKVNVFDKRKDLPKTPETYSNKEEMIPSFDSKGYKEKANKTLQEIGADVRVYNQTSYHILISILIGVIVIFGLFMVWSVSHDKFKTDFTCPDCNCPKAELSCPAVQYPDCVCDQTFVCPEVNNSDIIDAINNITLNLNASWVA